MNSLYVSDLDGTLLRSDATLSPRSRDLLTELLDDGMAFTIATARSALSVQQILGDLPLRLPIVCYNGGLLSDFETGDHHHSWGIDDVTARTAFDCCVNAGLSPFLSTGGPDRVYVGEPLNEGMRWYLDDRIKNQDPRLVQADPALGLDEQVMLLTIVGTEVALTALRAQIQSRCQVHTQLYENRYQPTWWWLTVHPLGISKATALQKLCADWAAAKRSDGSPREMVVFGDEQNDVEMFVAADRAFATANAAPNVKALAHQVIGAADEDAVALWLSEQWTRR